LARLETSIAPANPDRLRQINNFSQDSKMPTIPHIEKHFTATETVRDVVIGMANGLNVPFALAAGLSAAVSNTSVIVTAGLAEMAAGAIAMRLGGYLAAQTDAQHFASAAGTRGMGDR